MNKKVISIHSLSQPRTPDERLTWAMFKARVEAAGVHDNDPIDSIDISWGHPDDLQCNRDEEFGWQIKL